MTKFRIDLSAKATVLASVEVQAETRFAAEQAALLKAWGGDLVWKYDGADDETIQVDATKQL
jgi:hypothetical protein